MNAPGGLPQWFMSFAGDEGFRGAVVVSAAGLDYALTITRLAGLNPGGQIAVLEFPPGTVPHEYTFRLLDMAETRRLPVPPWSPEDFRQRAADSMTDPPRHDENQDPGTTDPG